MSFTILPAVDVRHGQAVQLVQGVDGTQQVFGRPLEAALRWQDEGATWLHLVNLDGAFGDEDSTAVVSAVVAGVTMSVELSGGIRDDATLEAALSTGCARVNIGTAAIENPAWVKRALARHGERIAISVDVRGNELASRGWTEHSDAALDEFLLRLVDAGCTRFVVTDVTRDGMLGGPNLQLLGHVAALTCQNVTASGGVTTLDDVRALASLSTTGVDSAIIGTALYLGHISLAAAMAISKQTEPGKQGSQTGEGGHGYERRR
jgi:1-(5-phosphoribosyl)-5-[(5-phosphoribosylamino)methylideneamino] imidazole-4-carboxamide isomerase/N-(5'phosphoribosyl)anthranilate isomerase